MFLFFDITLLYDVTRHATKIGLQIASRSIAAVADCP